MGRPFSVIKRANELKDALDNYRQWQDKTAVQKRADYTAQKAITQNPKTARISERGYLQPFGMAIVKKLYIACNIPVAGSAESGKTESESALITLVRDKVVTTGGYATLAAVGATSGNTVYSRRGIQSALAKVTVVDIGAKAANPIPSRKTKMPYTYRKWNAVSCPFGAKTGINSYEDAKLALSDTAVFVLNDTRKVYFKPQGDLGIAIV
ncbi:MAG: hypothetical protein HGA42_07060 [Nostocales cyanobacterium W4_Combined_metabat2_030]|nr:hypothetical protein [Nostocales cyanobacterium W4_Combined_metabat2_030]